MARFVRVSPHAANTGAQRSYGTASCAPLVDDRCMTTAALHQRHAATNDDTRLDSGGHLLLVEIEPAAFG
eukprot:6782898-Prymnesium_polylepis.1